jgi:hypothetical protein
MIPALRCAWLFCACLTLSLAGCNSSLNYEKTMSLGPGEVNSFSPDPPRREQKVTITFKSTETPVDVYVAIGNDVEAVASALTKYKTPQNVLASKLKARDGSLEVTIPAKTRFGAIVGGATKDTSVEVKITGK